MSPQRLTPRGLWAFARSAWLSHRALRTTWRHALHTSWHYGPIR